MKKNRSVLAVCLGMFLLTLFAPLAANADVTIYHVRVTISATPGTVTIHGNGPTAVYCDTGTSCGAGGTGGQIWSIPAAGITLTGTQTLVLSQTAGLVNTFGGSTSTAGNFDTSDRVIADSTKAMVVTLETCQPFFSLCTVTIEVVDTNPGSFHTIYNNSAGNALNDGNADPGSGNEAQPWGSAVYSPGNYTLKLGYADNAHGCTSSCLPDPFNGDLGTTAATNFRAAGTTNNGVCLSPGPCYDGGALLFTSVSTPPPSCAPNCITVTQGGWGATPHGNNPAAILAANFNSVFGPPGVSIGCAAGVTYTFKSAQAVAAFLPQGGTPIVLPPPSKTNPTGDVTVFAGQVLALTLNVHFSGPVFPGGLGAFVPFSTGPLAGKTVSQILGIADNVLGGCATPPDGMTVSDLNDAVDFINGLFDTL
jgi:hypothetical protein